MSRPSEYEFSGTTKRTVMERSGHACEQCGTPGYVEVHHILGIWYAMHYHTDLAPWLVASIDNAIALCDPCHLKADNSMADTHEIYAYNLKRKIH